MTDPFTHAVGQGIADVRAKLMEGWFGRNPDLRPNLPGAQDLGWSLGDHPGPSAPGHASTDADPGIDQSIDPDHGIDR